MRKTGFILCLLLLSVLTAACGDVEREQAAGEANVANPFIDCADLNEAAAIAGFDFTVPPPLAGYGEAVIQAVDSEMIQVIWGDDEDGSVYLRKGVEEDAEFFAGDYNEYSDEDIITVAGRTVTIRGMGNGYGLAFWRDGDYSFAIIAEPPLSLADITALIESMN